MKDKNDPTAGQSGGAQDKSSQQANPRSEPEKEQAKSTAKPSPPIHPFSNIFRDPQWRWYRPAITAPHRVGVRESDNGKVAVVVSLKTRATASDWTIRKDAIGYIIDAERAGRIREGHILLADNTWQVVASERACEVLTRIGNMPLSFGPWGEFWWLDATLKPAAGYRGAGNDEAPF